MKYLLFSLTIFCFSCQKKPYAFVQKSTQEQFVYKKNIVEQAILTTKIEAPTNVEADASIAKPIGDFQQKEVIESPVSTFPKKHSIPTSIKKKVKVGIVLGKMEQKFIPKKLLSNNATDEDLKRSGKISGILGLSSIVLILTAFISAELATLLLILAVLGALSALIFGIKPLRKLEKGNRTMAALGVVSGSIILLSFLVLFGIIANALNGGLSN